MDRVTRTNRRTFLKTAGAAFEAPAFLRNLCTAAPNEVVRHASFGASGMAGMDLKEIASHPKVKLICVAEVDLERAKEVRKKFPEARVYQDWREMLEREHKNLDSVNVSTPDHMHAAMAIAAMQLGLHVYGQKPLTHDVYESRRLAEFAAEKQLVTQRQDVDPFRLLRPAHRKRAPGRGRNPFQRPDPRMGRGHSHVQECSRGEPLHPPHVSTGLGGPRVEVMQRGCPFIITIEQSSDRVIA